jgi:hypothetical protein
MGDLMGRETKSAVVVGLAVGVEMRRLDHPAHEDEGDTEDAEQRDPADLRFRKNSAHAAVFDDSRIDNGTANSALSLTARLFPVS